jgi:hypothetical protein
VGIENMRKIPVYRGDGRHRGKHARPKAETVIAEALVSDEDGSYVSQHRYRLNKDGYVCRYEWVDGKSIVIFLHNEIASRMGLILKLGETVDHRDRVKLNCQRENFRAATRSLQNINKDIQKDSTSGVSGVSWLESRKRWVAYASLGGVQVLKSFKTKEEAIHARKVMEVERQQVMVLMGDA